MGRSGGGVGRAEAIQKTGLQPCPDCAGPLALSSRQISNPALLYAANHLQMMGCLSPAGFCSRANSNTGAAPCLSSTSRCRESGLYLASDMICIFYTQSCLHSRSLQRNRLASPYDSWRALLWRMRVPVFMPRAQWQQPAAAALSVTGEGPHRVHFFRP